MSKTFIAPRGWTPNRIEHRFSTSAPLSYSAAEHTAECIISAGAAVARVFGTEVLEISRAAVDLSRLPVPLLDSHSQSSIDNILGRIESAWISAGKLYGKLKFAQTPRGKMAEGMVARGELSGISAGYRVEQWAVHDADGNELDVDRIGWSDDGLTFTATRWQLFESSLVGVPADIQSAIRSAGGSANTIIDIKNRMTVRERMMIRQAMHDAQSEIFH